MQIGSTTIIDTFAEAFGMRYSRLIVTAVDDHWLGATLQSISGYGTSVIACDAEVGVEGYKRHWRHLVARYGALPVVWIVGGEAKDSQGPWSQVANYLHAVDP